MRRSFSAWPAAVWVAMCSARLGGILWRRVERRGWDALLGDPVGALLGVAAALGIVALVALWRPAAWAPAAVLAWHAAVCVALAVGLRAAAHPALGDRWFVAALLVLAALFGAGLWKGTCLAFEEAQAGDVRAPASRLRTVQPPRSLPPAP